MKKILVLAFTLSIISNHSHSQAVFDVRSMSLGNTSAANSYELSAFNLNPANILNQRANNNAPVYFTILTNAALMTGSSYLSLDFYNDYFTKDADGNTKTLTEQDKRNIINEASDQESIYFGAAKILSVIYNTKNIGSFGLSIDERTTGNFTPAMDFLELGLYGNESGRTYDLSETELNAYWIRQLNLSYANSINIKNNNLIEKLSYGVSVKPQFGLYYLNTQSNDLNVYTNDSNAIQGSGSMALLYSGLTDDNGFEYSLGNAGFGLAFDVGVNARIKNVSRYGIMNVGLSLTDIGYVNWTKNTSNYYYDGTYVITDITQKDQRDSLKDIIKGTKTPTSDFTTGLPAVLRVGASFQLFKNAKRDSATLEEATITMDYVQGFSKNFGATTNPTVGLGIEYNLSKVVSPRIGFAAGGREDFVMSIGLGIDTGPVLIDIGTYNIATIFTPKATTRYSAGLDISFKVN